MHLPLLEDAAPDLRVLLMVRSPIPTILSMRRHEGYRALAAAGECSWPKALLAGVAQPDHPSCEDLRVFLEIWRKRIGAALSFGEDRDPTRFAILRYEDLLASPRRELARIVRFFGEDASEPWASEAAAAIRPRKRAVDRECREAEEALMASPDAQALADGLGYAAEAG